MFSEIDSLHEMGVKAVFWSSWATIPRFYCLRSLPQPRIPVQLAVLWLSSHGKMAQYGPIWPNMALRKHLCMFV
jgi:hypothetical protein